MEMPRTPELGVADGEGLGEAPPHADTESAMSATKATIVPLRVSPAMLPPLSNGRHLLRRADRGTSSLRERFGASPRLT